MTIKDLLSGKPTLEQLDVLSRADLVCGRYYGGPLTDVYVELLAPKPTQRAAPKPTGAT